MFCDRKSHYMSYLMRNGTGRNNIVYGGNNTTSGNYLKRTADNNRNSIQWYTISTSGTHKLLERYNTSRNNIRWNNLTFSFGGDLTKLNGLIYIARYNGNKGNIIFRGTVRYCADISFTRNTISGNIEGAQIGSLGAYGTYQFGLMAENTSDAMVVASEVSKFNKMTIGSATNNITGEYTTHYYFDGGYGGLIKTGSPVNVPSSGSITITFS